MKNSLSNRLAFVSHSAKMRCYEVLGKANDVCDRAVGIVSTGLINANDAMCNVNDILEKNIRKCRRKARREKGKANIAAYKLNHKEQQMDIYMLSEES